jgi:hypothetical protein
VTHYHVGLATGKSILELDKLVESEKMEKEQAMLAYADIYTSVRSTESVLTAHDVIKTTLHLAEITSRSSVASWFGDEYAIYLTRCDECTKRLMN